MYEYMCCLPPCLRWRRSYMPPENVVPALLRKKIDPNLRLTMHDMWSLAGGLVHGIVEAARPWAARRAPHYAQRGQLAHVWRCTCIGAQQLVYAQTGGVLAA